MTDSPARGGGLAAAVVVLSVTGHLLGGGHDPSLSGLTLVTVMAALLTALLATRTRPLSTSRLAGVLGAFQIVAHQILHHVAGAGPVSTEALGGAHAAHAGHAVAASAPYAHAAHLAGAAGGWSLLMLTSHLLATVVLAWLVGPAWEQVRQTVRRILAPRPRPVRRFRPPAQGILPALRCADIGASVSLRGPPRLAVA